MSNGGHRSIKPDARFRADFIKDLSYASHLLNPAPTVQGEIATRRDHSRRKRWNIPPQRLHIQIVRHQQTIEPNATADDVADDCWESGRASCRERVCKTVEISEVEGPFKNKTNHTIKNQ